MEKNPNHSWRPKRYHFFEVRLLLTMYPAVFFKSQDGAFSVSFPDLPELFADGKDFNNAMTNAVDCLASYIFNAKKEGNKPPSPSSIDEVKTNQSDSIVNIVSVDVDLYARQHFEIAVKKTISIPKWLDEKAKAKKINFSKTLQDALIKQLNLK